MEIKQRHVNIWGKTFKIMNLVETDVWDTHMVIAL